MLRHGQYEAEISDSDIRLHFAVIDDFVALLRPIPIQSPKLLLAMEFGESVPGNIIVRIQRQRSAKV